MSTATSNLSTIDPKEVAYFEGLAHRWWDANGPFWPLHRLNAFRVDYIRDQVSKAFERPAAGQRPFEGLNVLDIGCGGGILSESVAELGARVTGTDVTDKNVRVASIHAEWTGLEIDYRVATVEDLAGAGATFDLVLNMEVVEHVSNLPGFLETCRALVRPGGVMVVATINRTVAALLIAIFGAEYVLRWMPKGTHHYRKLVKPAEVTAGLGPEFRVLDRTGVRINPLDRSFHYTRYLGVNYMIVLEKTAA
jgi:2-polyprenyl-6-hydroxyphenyl methylase/3-demethylubiquinone-9 3-methyltransferase